MKKEQFKSRSKTSTDLVSKKKMLAKSQSSQIDDIQPYGRYDEVEPIYESLEALAEVFGKKDNSHYYRLPCLNALIFKVSIKTCWHCTFLDFWTIKRLNAFEFVRIKSKTYFCGSTNFTFSAFNNCMGDHTLNLKDKL